MNRERWTTLPISTRLTGDQVKAAMIAAELDFAGFSHCSMCGYITRFLRDGENLLFDGGCYCVSYPPDPRTWDSAADLINMQNDEWKVKLADGFGITLTSETL